MAVQRRSETSFHRPQKKHFTLSEARKSLTYVSRIVRDITDCYGKVLDAKQRLELPRPEDIAVEVRAEYDSGMEKLNGLVEELQEVGVELKDFERGLIDFPAWHDGREIYLCWHLGEDGIHAWHEVDAGFAGRQDVALLEPVGAGSEAAGDEKLERN